MWCLNWCPIPGECARLFLAMSRVGMTRWHDSLSKMVSHAKLSKTRVVTALAGKRKKAQSRGKNEPKVGPQTKMKLLSVSTN